MKILALIPARGGSKRIKNKNITDFCEKPIISYPITVAKNSGLFTDVMVSTDDARIAEVAKNYGADVPFLRSEKNSDDFATTTDVILEVVSDYQKQGRHYDLICCIYPTAIFVTEQILRTAKDYLSTGKANSVFPIVKFSFPPQRGLRMGEDGFTTFINKEHEFTRSQDLEPIYHDSGQFYFLRTEDFLREKALVLSKTKPIIVEETQVQDIDNITDLQIAELKYRLNVNSSSDV